MVNFYDEYSGIAIVKPKSLHLPLTLSLSHKGRGDFFLFLLP